MKCPRCSNGFIEEMEVPPQQFFSDEFTDDGCLETVSSIQEEILKTISLEVLCDKVKFHFLSMFLL